MDYDKLYEKNENFRNFVDKTCRQYNISRAEALTYCAVKDVGDYYASVSITTTQEFEFIKHKDN